jgi:hypothetical protein
MLFACGGKLCRDVSEIGTDNITTSLAVLLPKVYDLLYPSSGKHRLELMPCCLKLLYGLEAIVHVIGRLMA